MFQQQLNITLKKIFETNDTKKTNHETETLKISSNDEYCIINNITKLQKIIDAVSTKRINERMKKFRCSSTFYLNCIKSMFKSNFKYDYDDQTKQVLNKTFEEFETLINFSNK